MTPAARKPINRFDTPNWIELLPCMVQRQDSTHEQLVDLHRVAVRLGMYDAADVLKASLLSRGGAPEKPASFVSLLAGRITDLPAVPRQVVALHFEEHLTFPEISAALGMTEDRIRQVYAQAMGEIRTFLTQITPAVG